MFQNIEEIINTEFRANDVYRESANKLGFKAEVDEVFRCDILEILGCPVGLTDNFGVETNFALMHAFLDNICHTGERTADDEENVPCIDNFFINLATFLEFHSGAHL